MSRFLPLFTILISLLFSTTTVTAQERAILVLDGSGSMWGQIDGEAKITIAQRVIADLLETLPETTELGLIAYGHREKGVCDDIETLVVPGPDTRDEILAAVNAISPKGKTPLSAAVLAAAEVLKYEEDKATVILVSDGRETCDIDPCVLGTELEKTGVDFTAHVVGFDVENDPEAKAQLQCLADNTGGRFLSADNASELSQALIEISAPVEPAFFDIEINARIENGGPFITDGILWWVKPADAEHIVEAANQADVSLNVKEGEYVIELLRPEDEATAETVITISSAQTITLELPELPVKLPEATVSGPESAPAGSKISVEWTGPAAAGDFISIAELGSDDVRYTAYTYTRDGSPLELQMPAKVGDYEIRYYYKELDVALARQAITVTEVTATITAPDTAAAGEDLSVDWEGPAYHQDYISVAEKGADNNRYINYTFTKEGAPLTLTMPAEAGEYEIRYVMSEGTTILATHIITVEEVSATITAPETAAAGEELTVEWDGPDYQNDYISVAEAGQDSNRYINYTYLREGNPLRLTMPAEAGVYELRYVQNQGAVILATEIITVEAVSASITAPETAVAGESLVLQWDGPDYQNDYLAIFAADAAFDEGYINYTYTREGDPLRLLMPTEPGEYEIRYIQNQDKVKLAGVPITVTAVSATLTIPAEGTVGEDMLIQWDGPDYQNDYVAVFRSDAAFDEGYINYTYTREGNPLRLLMPTEPGDYEIRYIQNQNKVILAAEQVTLTAVTGSITIPSNAGAGSDVVVQWDGPDYQNDYIAVFAQGDDDYINYTYTREGNPLRLTMPAEPGDYEIRYIINQDKVVLTSETITIDPVTATLTAAETAPVGEDIVVTWEGPDNQNDYIAVFAVSETDNDNYESYTYTREGNPLRLKMPDEAGDYEIRYIMKQGKIVLTSEPITVE